MLGMSSARPLSASSPNAPFRMTLTTAGNSTSFVMKTYHMSYTNSWMMHEAKVSQDSSTLGARTRERHPVSEALLASTAELTRLRAFSFSRPSPCSCARSIAYRLACLL